MQYEYGIRPFADERLSPDPLEKEAAACLIIINELHRQINAQYKNGLPVAVDMAELGPALQAAYTEYASIPILLTEETLRNPYAMQYADELSTRILLDREDIRNNNQAIQELRKEANLCARQGDAAGYVWSTHVLRALSSKSNFDTVDEMLANDFLLNFPEKGGNKAYENSTITNVQLNYMGTMDYRRQANPYLAQTMDAGLTVSDIVSYPATATKIIDLVKNKNIKKAIGELAKEIGKKAAGWYNSK